ncbi:hypothetical protein NP493_412g00010 [Ridgeia piscesae]|uniref:ABC transmembrane type-1 domain-containing protein n=1 Tax=Ridgeia piscesae TaxID=27915 RepID=A0AAD9NUE1_RIDPI|nr:hypothetical protein NP493_412g00010 [Ridgeia piscesae]
MTNRVFSAIPIDQAREQNNACIKSDGGTVGLTDNHSAFRRWVVAGHEVVALTEDGFEDAHQLMGRQDEEDRQGTGGIYATIIPYTSITQLVIYLRKHEDSLAWPQQADVITNVLVGRSVYLWPGAVHAAKTVGLCIVVVVSPPEEIECGHSGSGTGESKDKNDEAKPSGNEKEKKKGIAGFFTIFRMADCLDRLLMVVEVLAAMLHGVATPMVVYIFSEAVDVFVADTMATHNATGMETLTSAITPVCVRLTYWAVIIIVAGTIHMFCWKWTSERQVSRLRSQLFSAILHQDCAWFDSHDTGSLTVTLTNDIVNVMSGMSDKISNFLQNFTVFVVAFIMALATNWRLSLAAFSLVPFIAAFVLGAVIVSE